TSVPNRTSPRTASVKTISRPSGTRKRIAARSPAAMRAPACARVTARHVPEYSAGLPAATASRRSASSCAVVQKQWYAAPALRSSFAYESYKCSRSDWRYGPSEPPTSGPSSQSRPSHRRSRRIAASDSRVERSASVSSMRRMNAPPCPRASSQLNSAVRALPTCSCPVGLGANRTLIQFGIQNVEFGVRARILPSKFHILNCAYQRDGVGRNGLAAADRVHPFVRLALDADAIDADADRGRDAGAHLLDMILDLRPLENHGHVHVADLELPLAEERNGAPQQIEARRVLPTRIGIRK